MIQFSYKSGKWCNTQIIIAAQQKVYDFCAENGWVPISMKNDWLTVFGDGVTKKA